MKQLLTLTTLLFSIIANAAIVYVDHDNGGLFPNGNSWNSAYPTVQQALDNAVSGDQIWIAEGTYRGYHGVSWENISIYGGFDGTETALWQRDPDNHISRLSGDIGVIGLDTDNEDIACFLYGNVTVDGLRIKDYVGDGSYDAAIYFSGDALVRDCHFVHNLTDYVVECHSSGDLDFVDCIFWNNECSEDLVLTNGEYEFYQGCQFYGNELQHMFYLESNARCVLEDCIVRNNDVTDKLFDSSEIWNCLVYENTAGVMVISSKAICTTFADNSGYMDFALEGSYNVVLRNNDIDLSTELSISFSICDDPILEDAGNIQDFVEFVDSVNDDYHLTDCSPGINKGINAGLPLFDLDGLPRSFDGTVDMGCFEVQNDFPDRIYVNKNASGSNNGTSWTNAYTELRNAINNACPYSELWVAQGTYTPTAGTDESESFHIPTGMKIYGGFVGGESALFQRDYLNNWTVLSGEIGSAGTVDDNSNHVVVCSSTKSETILDGLIIRDGNADSGPGNTNGGGLYGIFCSAQILNCYFINNYCSGSGAGAAFTGVSDPYIEGCYFDNNHADVKGGALYASELVGGSPNLWVEKCRIWLNTAGVDGGAFFLNNVNTTIESCLFRDNDAIATDPLPGDAVAIEADRDCSIINCTIVRNHEIGVSNYGNLFFHNSILWDHDWGSYTNWLPAVADIQYSIVEFGPTDNNNLNSNPNFVSPFFNNFHLGLTSPAINSGNNGFVLNSEDVDYEPRIDQAIVDRGFKETQNGCSNSIDVCENAQNIGQQQFLDGSIFSGTTECSTNAGEPPASCGAFPGKSVWYEFSAGVEGGVELDLYNIVPITAVFNPKITIFEGTCDNLTEIHCVNDNGDNLGEHLELSGLNNAEEYFIRIEGANAQEGTFDFLVDPTQGEFVDVSYELGACEVNGKIDLILTLDYIHPPNSGWINVNGTNHNITGSPQVINMNNLEADGSSMDMHIYFTSNGADIEFQQDDFLTLPCCAPVNDVFPYTIEVDASPVQFHNRCAGSGGDPTSSCYSNGDNSVWFEFEAQEGPAHEIFVDYQQTLIGNFFNPRVTVYDFFTNEEIICSDLGGYNSDETVYIPNLDNGGFYKVKVDGFGAEAGRFNFSIDQVELQGCPEDFNQSGQVDTADLLQLLAAFGCTSNCGIEDLNSNGSVDTADLLQFLAAFGSNC